MDICPECGLDRDSLGIYKGFSHYKGDPSLGHSRPTCNEGYVYKLSPEAEAYLNDISAQLAKFAMDNFNGLSR